MDVYIKPKKKVVLAARDALYVRDVAEVYAPGQSARKLGDLRLLTFANEKKAYLVSAMDIVQHISRAMPDATVNNVGELDTLVEYAPKPHNEKSAWKITQAALVALVLFVGSATAIMSFHTDGEIPKVFSKFHEIFFGQKTDKPYIINIPYSIGLAAGIMLFFNHFIGRKVTNDPTPIEVQMAVYDNDVTETLVDALGAEAGKKESITEKPDKGGRA